MFQLFLIIMDKAYDGCGEQKKKPLKTVIATKANILTWLLLFHQNEIYKKQSDHDQKNWQVNCKHSLKGKELISQNGMFNQLQQNYKMCFSTD